ncbi:hypothetical protein O181_117705, partial [Austropuccinia psidii MF-1]|nr:hypothetical protein [Austropuccinia psidii MF-1]
PITSGGLRTWLKLRADILNCLLRLFEMSDHTMGNYMSKTATTTTLHSALISSLPNSKSQDFDKCESLGDWNKNANAMQRRGMNVRQGLRQKFRKQ